MTRLIHGKCGVYAVARYSSKRLNDAVITCTGKYKKNPWSELLTKLYRPSDRLLALKRVPTLADRRCHVVSATDPYGRILGFLDRSSYIFYQVDPQLCSRG
jgi:hypothetical protein